MLFAGPVIGAGICALAWECPRCGIILCFGEDIGGGPDRLVVPARPEDPGGHPGVPDHPGAEDPILLAEAAVGSVVPSAAGALAAAEAAAGSAVPSAAGALAAAEVGAKHLSE